MLGRSETICCCLNVKCPHRLECLNTWSPAGDSVFKDCGKFRKNQTKWNWGKRGLGVLWCSLSLPLSLFLPPSCPYHDRLSFLKLGGENQTKPNHDQLQDTILYQPSNRGSPQPFQSLYYSIHNKNTVNMWSDFKWRRVQKRKRRWKWEAVGSWGWGSVSCVWFSGFGEGHWSRERPTGRCWIWEKSPELDGREHHAGVV